MYSELEKHFTKNNKVKVWSDIEDDEETYYGYIVGLTRNFVCLWCVEYWHHDGFMILPIKHITEIRHGKNEKTDHRILKLEGRLVDVEKPKWLKIGSYKSIFKSLEKNYNNVIVESRLPSSDVFVLGKILNIANTEVQIKGFDATGKWEDEVYIIPFKEITAVKFGDEYSSIFRKYVLEAVSS